MGNEQKKRSILTRFRNYFIAGVVVLIPIGITIYVTILLVSVSSIILPKEITLQRFKKNDINPLDLQSIYVDSNQNNH